MASIFFVFFAPDFSTQKTGTNLHLRHGCQQWSWELEEGFQHQ
jgi:hypothetical protein